MKGPCRAGFEKVAGIFALGAAAGSAVALLLAPASGKAIRKRLTLELKLIERKAEQKIVRAKKLLARKAMGLRENASEKLEDTREWLVERFKNHHKPVSRRVGNSA